MARPEIADAAQSLFQVLLCLGGRLKTRGQAFAKICPNMWPVKVV
jgi:hypothetical protein